jgi:hypothetical protein
VHRRTVELDAENRTLSMIDEVTGGRPHPFRLAFHLGPAVDVELDGALARLRWDTGEGSRTASLHLPDALDWAAHRGEVNPPLGWYSAGFGRREPATTLVGRGRTEPGATRLTSTLTFNPAREETSTR